MQQQLDNILEKWNLLKHPFYQAWNMGTLPVTALHIYAREYGNFIATLPRGWETLNDAETAQEEREHAEMWKDFTAALGSFTADASLQQTSSLVATSQALFAARASALGALYAFEAQQPATAQSKLDGLKTHYKLPQGVEPYFEVHAKNWHESEKILRLIETLPPAEQAETLAACEQMARSLWDALTGIHDAARVN
ncbi:MAG: PqqC-like protein [Anaerolineales bacterium]|nr:PqqC-like protein [Anaerolineales bacterium]